MVRLRVKHLKSASNWLRYTVTDKAIWESGRDKGRRNEKWRKRRKGVPNVFIFT